MKPQENLIIIVELYNLSKNYDSKSQSQKRNAILIIIPLKIPVTIFTEIEQES